LKNTVSPTPGDVGENVKVAVGAVPAPPVIVMGDVVTPVWPISSVTVRVTVFVPLAAYACVGVTPVPVEPSPKFQAYDAIV
jgi:hypothetical protein